MKVSGTEYALLGDYLNESEYPTEIMSFAQIEGILGKALPPAARQKETWWTNLDIDQEPCTTLIYAGWQVMSVDLDNELVTFVPLGGHD